MRTITLLLLALVLVAGADSVLFQPDPTVGKDAHGYSLHPDTNYGDDTYLLCGQYLTVMWASFVEFTELNDAQYQGATVNTALFYTYVANTHGTGEYRIGPCDSVWYEPTLTWNHMPTVHESTSASYSEVGWLGHNVTSWVQNWLDGTWNNNGLAMFSLGDGSDRYMHIVSSDFSSEPSLRPFLSMDYTPASAVEEATWGEIKASF